MANYVLVYHGGSMPETPEAGAQVMKAWTDWFQALGDAVVDGGNPASRTKTIAPDGSVSDDANGPSGYSIIKADSLDAAVEIAKGCPVLQGGASLQVVETFDAM
jgi:YCII-related domain.